MVKRKSTRVRVKGRPPLKALALVVGLMAAIALIYGQTLGFSFINYDDDSYVSANGIVRAGLTAQGVRYAFTVSDRFYWHPLTWLSYMAEIQLFGNGPAVHHATNILLHALGSVLLLVWLTGITKSPWKSLAVTALFALHPLRVESVAWIAERKDVLSGALTFAVLCLYTRYLDTRSTRNYVVLIGVFVLALMAKPMAITIPILLLLLDWWPLRRAEPWTRLIREKLPMFAAAAGCGLATYLIQVRIGSMHMVGDLPFLLRLSNAVHSLGQYLIKTFYPSGLVILYPYRTDLPMAPLFATVTLAITVVAIIQRKRCPYLLFGWLWFVVGISPALGIVQSGVQAMGDRFTYIPHVGLLVAIVWLISESLKPRHAVAAATAVVAVLGVLSWVQTRHWQDSISVFEHALRHTTENWLAELKLGVAYAEKGQEARAESHLLMASRLRPDDIHSYYHLGKLYAAGGRSVDAARNFSEAIRIKPDYADAHYSLAVMRYQTGDSSGALQSFDQAIAFHLEPQYAAEAHNTSGVILAQQGRMAHALIRFEAALGVKTDFVPAHRNRAMALVALARPAEAIASLTEASRRTGSPELRQMLESLQTR
jgi:Flp pilus assembly protein TadD